MAHKTFQEYLDNKSKFSSKGKIEAKADYSGPKDSAPKKEKKHKDAGGKGQGQPKPYKGGKDAKDPNKGKLGDGFAEKGDKDLKYTPGDKEKGNFITGGKEAAGVPGGKTVSSDWNKTKTQEWLNRTKDLSLAEFTKMIQKTTSKGLDDCNECACQESANDVVKQTVAMANANRSIMVSLVREMKRSKLFGKIVAEMLQHDETYKVLAHFMERDERYARRLVRAMNEMVGPPAHKDDIDDDEDPAKPPHPEDMHGSDDDDMDMDMGDDMGMGDPHGHHGHHDMDGPHGHPMGGDDMGLGGDDDLGMGGMGGDDMGMGGMGGDDMGMGGMGGDDMGMGGDEHDPTMGPHGHHGDPDADIAPGSKIMPARKKKKKHAHHHLMAALKDSPMGQDAGGMGASGGGNLSI